jgi:hypothetical protein
MANHLPKQECGIDRWYGLSHSSERHVIFIETHSSRIFCHRTPARVTAHHRENIPGAARYGEPPAEAIQLGVAGLLSEAASAP